MPEPVTIPSGLENISMLAHDKILRAPGHHGKVFLKVHQLFLCISSKSAQRLLLTCVVLSAVSANQDIKGIEWVEYRKHY